jgi:selenide,water dikinase
MGARPLFALNMVGFPPAILPPEVLAEILRGGQSKAAEAGIAIIGGHTVRDDEPKYGLAVTGSVHPDRIVRNSGAKPGDVLYLTKALGIGIITTAIKRDVASDDLTARAVAVMTALNRGAGEAMVEVGVSAATDITGFGLLGHLRELTAGSGVAAEISYAAVPILEGACSLARDGIVPGGSRDNLEFLDSSGAVEWHASLTETDRLILADAQTSGGLLIAVPEARAGGLEQALRRHQTLEVAQIGRVTGADPLGRVRVLG